MRMTSIMAAAAVVSIMAAPVFAAAPANPAAKLSLANKSVRAGAPMKRSNKARSSTLLLVGAGAAVVIGAAIAMGGSDSKPASN